MNRRLSMIFIAFALIAIIGCASTDYSSPVEITSERLWEEFCIDKKTASSVYENNLLSVSGIIAEIIDNFLGYPCILLENGVDSIPDGIFIMFPDGFDVFQYHIGEEITVVGRCSLAVHVAGDDTTPTIFVYVED